MRLLFHPFGVAIWQDMSIFGYIYSFSSKKFGYFKLKQYLCTTRTRQASPLDLGRLPKQEGCSNVRVVFLYNEQ